MSHDIISLLIFCSSSLYVFRILLIKFANGLNIKLSAIFRQYFYDINMLKMAKLWLYIFYIINKFLSLFYLTSHASDTLKVHTDYLTFGNLITTSDTPKVQSSKAIAVEEYLLKTLCSQLL